MSPEQKQLGIHYTREDISEYIAQNTIIPFLFDATKKKYPAAFEPDRAIWQLLREHPDRYIYEAVRRENYLPTETEREYTARRNRYAEIKARMLAGEIVCINDLITHNLDIRCFARDVIEYCEKPDLLRAFYESIEQITILDPTCGSGAFLLAALNVLEPLYETCLDRMSQTVTIQDDRASPGPGEALPRPYSTELSLLYDQVNSCEVRQPGNGRYGILKSIIQNNLYGVDISKEAIEICKLRLLLKLVACIERMEDIESLPNIDRNIRVGNALVGFASYNETRRATLGEDQLCLQANELRTKLDYYLASEDGIDPNNALTFEQWRSSHQPFHWCVEFDKIMQNDGFDVIIGNPPYVEYSEVKDDYRLPVDTYKTGTCGNLYAYCLERSIEFLNDEGRWGMIVPLSGFATDRMHSLQQLVMEHSSCLHLSFLSGDANPSKLFAGVKFRLCIGLVKISSQGNRKHGDHKGPPNPTAPPSPLLYDGPPTPVSSHREKLQNFTYYSTRYVRWYAEARETLFSSLQYCQSTDAIIKGSLPKVGQDVELAILKKLTGQPALRSYMGRGDKALYYHNCPVNWIRATTFVPRFQSDRDGMKVSSQIRQITFSSEEMRDAAICIINSTLFFWFWLLYSDCYHLTEREIGGFPVNLNQLAQGWGNLLSSLSNSLMFDYKKNTKERTYVYKTTGRVVYDEFYPKLSKPIIDEIDRVFARHYGFSDEELDFIINYEIKYRMGRASDRLSSNL